VSSAESERVPFIKRLAGIGSLLSLIGRPHKTLNTNLGILEGIALNITMCPPAPAHFLDDSEPIFYKRAKPVDASGYREDEEPHSYVSYENLHSMSVHTRKESKKSVPEWLLKDDGSMLREVITRTVERRAGYWEPQPGTQMERLIMAEKKCFLQRESKIRNLENMCNRYVDAKCSGDLETAKKLESIIEGLDTAIIGLSHPAALIAGVLYFSWRCGLNSVSVSQALQGRIHPTTVRQYLHRCRILAEMIEGKRPPRAKPTGRRRRSSAPVTPAPVSHAPGTMSERPAR
jgi:hypothetical protein